MRRTSPSSLAVWLTLGVVSGESFTTCLHLDQSPELSTPHFLHLDTTYSLGLSTSKSYNDQMRKYKVKIF